jgi:predicted DNA-binding transcriptional regulator YafY
VSANFEHVVVRLVWLFCYFQRHKIAKVETARREYGVSLRTFRRDISRLRAAGVSLVAYEEKGALRFAGFDPLYAEFVREARNAQTVEAFNGIALREAAAFHKEMADVARNERDPVKRRIKQKVEHWRVTRDARTQMMLDEAYSRPVR